VEIRAMQLPACAELLALYEFPMTGTPIAPLLIRRLEVAPTFQENRYQPSSGGLV